MSSDLSAAVYKLITMSAEINMLLASLPQSFRCAIETRDSLRPEALKIKILEESKNRVH